VGIGSPGAQKASFREADFTGLGFDAPRLGLFSIRNQTPDRDHQENNQHHEKATANKLSAVFDPFMEW